ncbi:MAG: NAD-dependent epimerase/dehydratase family protein [Phycisphaerales bacterium]|jgi:UDP-glucose 4-epimerase|nr:NAD-dependent epimerase/dehydratase family protein [Phycisphaerales bacterium]
MKSHRYNNFFTNRTVLVTGGAGFIGSALATKLRELGATVRVLDDVSTGHYSNVADLDVTCIEGSILDTSLLERCVEGCDCVFHQAAMVSVPASVKDPKRCFDINVTGTKQVLDFAAKSGVRRVMFAASSAVYGPHASLPSVETMTPDPASPYAESKLEGEKVIKEYALGTEMDTVSLRYFNIFGPKQDPHSQYAAVVAAFMEALLHKRNPQVYGDGLQTRDFTYINNAVHANLLAASCNTQLHGEVFNIGTGHSHSLLDMLALMSKTIGVEPTVDFHLEREGDVPHSRASIEKATNKFGYSPVVSFEDGIARLFTDTAGLPA